MLRNYLPTLTLLFLSACVIDHWEDERDPWSNDDRTPSECTDRSERCPSPDAAEYLLQSPELCALVSFSCDADETAFSGPCGCGCEPAPMAGGRPTPGTGPNCPPEDGETFYLSRDETACRGIDFNCPDGKEAFSGACGCGCRVLTATTPPSMSPGECPRADTPGVRYLCEDAERCAEIEFSCPQGEGAFSGPCGCGCIAAASTPDDCPDPNAPGVLYMNPAACGGAVDFQCPEGCIRFDGACGCGCIEN